MDDNMYGNITFINEPMDDPYKIDVSLHNNIVPIVMLLGPAACGKTMLLIRLTRFLRNKGYNVTPVRSFRPHDDAHYRQLCDKFDTMANSDKAAAGMGLCGIMLVEVSHQGQPICQILDAVGECYFSTTCENDPLPYIQKIWSSPNRKLWTFFVEAESYVLNGAQARDKYVQWIANVRKQMSAHDKVALIYSKFDLSDAMIRQDKPDMSIARSEIYNRYPGMFQLFANNNRITKLWRPFNAEMVPFISGWFSQDSVGEMRYVQGPDLYPEMLWNMIVKSVKKMK